MIYHYYIYCWWSCGPALDNTEDIYETFFTFLALFYVSSSDNLRLLFCVELHCEMELIARAPGLMSPPTLYVSF